MKLSYGLLAALFVLATASLSFSQTYVNVSATGTNDGTSWQNAYTKLADALDNYDTGDEIWVAAGTYLPEIPDAWTGAIRRTFYIHKDVAIYGGFSGTETSLNQRDPSMHVTALSGDIAWDDIAGDFENNRSDNVLNLIHITQNVSNAAVLDGFTIRGGHAADTTTTVLTDVRGGGMFCYGSPTIRNCTFTQNYASSFGGGLYLRNASSAYSIVEDCVFEGNSSGAHGGGMIAYTPLALNSIQVRNCQFLNNFAASGGAGLYVSSALVDISDCIFSENTSLLIGGGLYFFSNTSHSKMSVKNTVFMDNISSNGGAFWYYISEGGGNDVDFDSCNFVGNAARIIDTDSFPDAGAFGIEYFANNPVNDTIRIRNCIFEDNSAEGSIGAFAYFNLAGFNNYVEVDNCLFKDNFTEGGVSALGVYEETNKTSMMIRNSVFENNIDNIVCLAFLNYDTTAPDLGSLVEVNNCLFTGHDYPDLGGVLGAQNATLDVVNSTISGNDASSLIVANGKIRVQNSILNSINKLNFISADSSTVYEVISRGGNLISDDALNTWAIPSDQTNTDPLFEMGTYQLAQSSPAVDAGLLPDVPPTHDLAGNMRLQGGCIDIGAYESPYDAGTACLTGTREDLVDPASIAVYPNPVYGITTFSVENNWRVRYNSES